MSDGDVAAQGLALPKAVLFDWDNTLADNWAVVHAALTAAQQAMGHAPWNLDQTRQRVRRSLRDSFPEMFGSRWEEARDIFYRTFEARHLEFLRPRPGAGELLAAVAERGVYQAVVSNKTGRLLRAEAAHLSWDGYFGAVIGANDAAADKPDPAPVDMALAPSGIARGKDVWFVGDTVVDLECATEAGCPGILIRDAPPRPGEFDHCRPVLHVAGCAALHRLLERL